MIVDISWPTATRVMLVRVHVILHHISHPYSETAEPFLELQAFENTLQLQSMLLANAF